MSCHPDPFQDTRNKARFLLADPIRTLYDTMTIARNDVQREQLAAQFLQRQPYGAVVEAELVGQHYLLRSFRR